jgi:hypothetical protein
MAVRKAGELRSLSHLVSQVVADENDRQSKWR